MPISHLEERWSAYGFIRIHRGFLVQFRHITEFSVTNGLHAVTVAGHSLPVSRRHVRDVRDRILRAGRRSLPCPRPIPAIPRPGAPGPGRQRVVWRPDQVPVQHDVPGLSDLRDDTSTGRLLVRSLMRAQLGLSLMCLTFALTLTASFPVVAAMAPAITRIDGGRHPAHADRARGRRSTLSSSRLAGSTTVRRGSSRQVHQPGRPGRPAARCLMRPSVPSRSSRC